jgi:hypothetical protein
VSCATASVGTLSTSSIWIGPGSSTFGRTRPPGPTVTGSASGVSRESRTTVPTPGSTTTARSTGIIASRLALTRATALPVGKE